MDSVRARKSVPSKRYCAILPASEPRIAALCHHCAIMTTRKRRKVPAKPPPAVDCSHGTTHHPASHREQPDALDDVVSYDSESLSGHFQLQQQQEQQPASAEITLLQEPVADGLTQADYHLLMEAAHRRFRAPAVTQAAYLRIAAAAQPSIDAATMHHHKCAITALGEDAAYERGAPCPNKCAGSVLFLDLVGADRAPSLPAQCATCGATASTNPDAVYYLYLTPEMLQHQARMAFDPMERQQEEDAELGAGLGFRAGLLSQQLLRQQHRLSLTLMCDATPLFPASSDKCHHCTPVLLANMHRPGKAALRDPVYVGMCVTWRQPHSRAW